MSLSAKEVIVIGGPNGAGKTTTAKALLPSPDLAIDRVALRVSRGGHNIPEDLVRRRYWKGLANFHQGFLPIADVAAVYDNSEREGKLVAEKTPEGLIVHDPRVWTRIQMVIP